MQLKINTEAEGLSASFGISKDRAKELQEKVTEVMNEKWNLKNISLGLSLMTELADNIEELSFVSYQFGRLCQDLSPERMYSLTNVKII